MEFHELVVTIATALDEGGIIQRALDWDYLRRWATQHSTWDVLDALRQRLSETA